MRYPVALAALALLVTSTATAQPATDLQAEGLRYWAAARAMTTAPPKIAGCLSPEASRRVIGVNSAITASDQAAWLEAWRAGADAYARQTEIRWLVAAATVATRPESPASKSEVEDGVLARSLLDEMVHDAPAPTGLTPEARAIHDGLLAQAVCRTEEADTKWLKGVVQEYGWPDRLRFSQGIDHAAWRMVQHADNDLTWQQEALTILRGLLDTDATDPANVAYLADRVAVRQGQPQRYGTQGACVARGQWVAEAIRNMEEIDDRRAELGLESFVDAAAKLSKACP